MSTATRSSRPAATVVLLRDAAAANGSAAQGCELLLLRRHGRSGFAANAWVFPGGVVEKEDRNLPPTCFRGLDPRALASRFGDPADLVLGFHVAAVRETFEEAGILLADGVADADDLSSLRAALGSRAATAQQFVAFLQAHDLVLRLDALTYAARWITPHIEGRRFNTVFFLATAPAGQDARHDEIETTAKRWMRPRAALDAHRAGDMPMLRPTVQTLEWVAAHSSVRDVMAAAAAQETVPWILPHITRGDDGSRVTLHPSDPGYPYERYADELQGPRA